MTRKLKADLERIIEAGIEITDSTESFKIDADGTIGGDVSEEGGTVPWTEKIRIFPQVEEGFHDSYRKPFFIVKNYFPFTHSPCCQGGVFFGILEK